MIVREQAIAPPVFTGRFIQSLMSVTDSRRGDKTPVDDFLASIVPSSALYIENWSAGLWWRSSARGGARSAVTIAEIVRSDSGCGHGCGAGGIWYPPVPDRNGATPHSTVDAVERWDGSAWAALPLAAAPLGWQPREPLGVGDLIRITATASPPAAVPAPVDEALRRLVGYRDQYRPRRGSPDAEPVPLSMAMRRSGAQESLAGAGYGEGLSL